MLALLEESGWQITSRPEEADLLLVNTCGFIASACQEAVDTVLELAAVKQDRPEPGWSSPAVWCSAIGRNCRLCSPKSIYFSASMIFPI